MTTTNETTASSKTSLGLLLAPIAVLLAMLTDQIGGFGLGFENDLYPLLIVAAGAMLGRVPSLLAEREVLPASTSTLSPGRSSQARPSASSPFQPLAAVPSLACCLRSTSSAPTCW